MTRLRARLLCASMALAAAAAVAADFPAPALYAEHAEEIALADYRAQAVLGGVRVRWDGSGFRDIGGGTHKPPKWFSAGFPAQEMDGRITAAYLGDNAIGRILRAAAGADDGWRKLTFVALDAPDADGGWEARQETLHAAVAAANLPNLHAAPWQTFADAAALQSALDEMYAAGGAGYILHHKDADYDEEGAARLLALPYALGEATVAAHRPGKGQFTGMMGSMEVADDSGGEFIIATGYTRAQRRDPPKIGARIAYRYKGFTATGKPKNPVFLQVLGAARQERKIGGVLRTAHLMWIFVALMCTLAALDAATHTAGGRRWNFKSAIVSTGLLGTFVGVFWGLYNFNTDDIAAGVPALLEGLKLSFVTSIVGIGLSTILSVVQTILGQAE